MLACLCCTNRFDTNPWWETEVSDVAGPSLDGCKTNANATEEPRSIIMTMNAKDMVDVPDGRSIDRMEAGVGSVRLAGGGDRSDQTGMLL